MVDFTLECFQNEYLPEGGREVNALVTITASGTSRPAVGVPADGVSTDDASVVSRAEIIVIDASGSMDGNRMREARRAAAAAIDCIEDGVRFAVIAGNHAAWRLYPDLAGLALAVSSPAAREDARQAIARLNAGGGTAIGTWIELAAGLFGSEPRINHALLLTDGKDEGESPEDLRRALDIATDVFQCDCRGVGADWNVAELRSIAAALLGEADIVADPADLTDDFTSIMRSAMAKTVGDVHLRLWTPVDAEIRFVRRTAPEQDLTATRVEVDERNGDYPTGAWGDEVRDYHIAIKVLAQDVGTRMAAGRVTLMVDGQPAGQALLRAVWTDDVALSTRVNRELAHAEGQKEMAEAIDAGMEARRQGDLDTATRSLARAVQLAAASGNAATLASLEKVVDVEDAATGRIRLKSKVDKVDELAAEIGSTKTNRLRT